MKYGSFLFLFEAFRSYYLILFYAPHRVTASVEICVKAANNLLLILHASSGLKVFLNARSQDKLDFLWAFI